MLLEYLTHARAVLDHKGIWHEEKRILEEYNQIILNKMVWHYK
jgi:hypothetical protein